jgi:hypothetical protein
VVAGLFLLSKPVLYVVVYAKCSDVKLVRKSDEGAERKTF